MHKVLTLRRKVLSLIILATLCATASSTFAQDQAAPSQQKQKEGQEPMETLKVNVNVVQLFFNVKDKKGALIPGLTKDDFAVAEDGKPQTIKYFAAESNLPLTLGILIDSSGSQRNVLDMEKEVGGAFLRQILKEKDEAFVIGFDIDVDLLQDFTNDVRRLQDGLNKAKINIGSGGMGLPGTGGDPIPTRNPAGTLLYDAIY